MNGLKQMLMDFLLVACGMCIMPFYVVAFVVLCFLQYYYPWAEDLLLKYFTADTSDD